MSIQQSWKKAIVSGAAAFALTAGTLTVVAMLPQAVSAQDDGTPAPSAPGYQERGNPDRSSMRGPGGPQDEALAKELGITVEELQAAHEATRTASGDRHELLAQALGITVDELDAALQAVRDSRLQEALSSGEITQEEYDLIQAREAFKQYIDRETLTAQALGITVEELQAYRDAGTRMDEILTEVGIDAETFRTNMEAGMEAALQGAVDDGVITADQAAQLQEGPGPEFGHRGHIGGYGDMQGGGHRGPEHGQRPSAPPADAPAPPDDNPNL